ncbi:VCBS repeat-containing protein [Mucilaginibacter sp.]|uniref:FG-GAP repeat domain-containing protein n=1 Tax=Mucilaginibacter sp. TaxID=1882438 RepID=UPI00283F21EC|nr:VCBS repeat-containing protein [Mucilaginibacter sp.]MDR3694644.1 VCBS repeat-containing protein [Mucilaginibacter sp.]
MNFKKHYLFIFYLLVLIGLCSGSLLLNGCSSKESATYTITGDTLVDGKKLVEINCAKCHALVPANALNKNVWSHHTLPHMAHYLGLSSYLGGYYKSEKDTGGMSLAEWQIIVGYYQKLAPDTILSIPKPTPLLNDWAGFTLKKPGQAKFSTYTTMAIVNPFTHKIYSSDALTDRLLEWDSNFNSRKVTTLPSTTVNAIFKKDDKGNNIGIFSSIGQIQAVDFPNGRVLNINLDSKTDTTAKLIADDLARPVETLEGDFNKDGLTDIVILGQGHYKGGVYLFKQNADHSYTQSNISNKPGAVQAVAGDFNNDGWQDLMIMFGSGDEGLWLFLNDHKGGFIEKNLLHFPPVYGSTSFQLADMDHDGKPDLIYTCGYNFNDSRILKPYHGVYIFKNIGNWDFKQKWFYPIDGCTKAIAADFDGDGDLDIATSAYYTDLKNNPAEGFVYFEQVSPFNFKAHAIPISKYGRWFTMDVGDYNNDGKPDIVLGNYGTGFMIQNGFKPFWDAKTPFIVLENNFKK